MAEGEVKISALPSGSSLTGVEKIPMVQGGITIEASAQEIADLSIPLINSKQDRLAGIVSGCVITVETFSGTPVATNKQIRVTSGTWYIPTSEYAKATDTVSAEITLCPTGGDFKYYDIVADNTNAITIHEGTPSTAPAHYVIDPATEVLLGFITVGDAVIEEPVVTPSSRIYSNYFPQLITTTNQSLSVQTIQGLHRLNALFLNQTDPLDNGLYGWNGSVWAKFSFPMGFWDTETDFLYNTLFIAQEGDYANQAFVFNNYIGNRSSRNISGGGSGTTQSSQAQVEAAFDNTNQTTPVVLEQTSALTPFNAWWLVQKIKTWVKAGFTLTGSLNFAPSVSLASSTNPALGATASNNVTITGTTTIAGFDNVADGITRVVKFSGILQLTYNATSLILPTSANITTSAGDIAVFRSLGSGNWECIDYTRKDGAALVSGGLMAANTVKGNNTGSTANAADLTTDQFTAMMENATTVATAGILTALTSATYKYLRLTGCTGLGSILAPSGYKDLYIWNDVGATLTLYNEYLTEATAANRIICGSNQNWANNTMLHLKYDVVEARWCLVSLEGSTYRPLLAGTGVRLVETSATGEEQAIIQTLDIDFTGGQQTAATSATWTGVNEVNIAGLLQGQLYIDYATTGYRYECHRNDWCSRTPVINVEVFTTNSLYPIFEVTGTSGTFGEDEAYVLNNASQVVMTLPTVGTLGKVIIVNAKGAGGGRINTSATQQIVGTSGTQPTAGQDISFPQHSAITLKCTTGHATAAVWSIVSVNPATTITII